MRKQADKAKQRGHIWDEGFQHWLPGCKHLHPSAPAHFFWQNCAVQKVFEAEDLPGCAGAMVLGECNCESLEHIVGLQGFKAS